MSENYDALLFVSFGAPEKPDDVMPFLRNVVRGRGVPDERLLEVAENYQMFGGRSPLNEQNKELIALLRERIDLPIYWGNRNWNPFLTEAISEMKRDGVKRTLAFVTSAYSSYSGCRQYRENIEGAKAEAEASEIGIDKIRVFYNHPLFVEANAENLQTALEQIPIERRDAAEIVFTAHSLPVSMAANCDYQAQLEETARLITAKLNRSDWKLAFQSRSGAPHIAWLEPDINDFLRASNAQDFVVQPIGFLSDHQEVVFDLDTQAQETAHGLGKNLVRAATVGTHPKFVEMIAELIRERTENAEKRFLGTRGAKEDFCPANCCLAAVRR